LEEVIIILEAKVMAMGKAREDSKDRVVLAVAEISPLTKCLKITLD
jgi:hypothetical protein